MRFAATTACERHAYERQHNELGPVNGAKTKEGLEGAGRETEDAVKGDVVRAIDRSSVKGGEGRVTMGHAELETAL